MMHLFRSKVTNTPNAPPNAKLQEKLNLLWDKRRKQITERVNDKLLNDTEEEKQKIIQSHFDKEQEVFIKTPFTKSRWETFTRDTSRQPDTISDSNYDSDYPNGITDPFFKDLGIDGKNEYRRFNESIKYLEGRDVVSRLGYLKEKYDAEIALTCFVFFLDHKNRQDSMDEMEEIVRRKKFIIHQAETQKMREHLDRLEKAKAAKAPVQLGGYRKSRRKSTRKSTRKSRRKSRRKRKSRR